MKTNRQNNFSRVRPSQHCSKGFGQFVHAKQRYKGKKDQNVTLSSLFNRAHQGEVVKIICKDQVIVHIQQNKEGIRGLGLGKSRQRSKTVYIKCGTPNIMRECMEEWQQHQTTTFIFSARDHEEPVRSFRSSGCEMVKNVHLAKTASETSLKQLSSRPSSGSKQQNHTQIESDNNLPQDNKASFGKYLSQKNISDKEGMFTVEQLKESIQSDARSSFKSNHDKQNRQLPNLSELNFYNPHQTFNYLEKMKSRDGIEQKQANQPAVQRQNNKNMPKMNEQDDLFCIEIPPKENDNIQTRPTTEHNPPEVKSTQIEPQPRFSFSSHMRKGLIQNQQSSLEPEMSFKIAGDSSIQNQKQKTKGDFQVSSLGQLSQMSSIVSNAKQDPFKKDTEHEVNAIKNELQDIKFCLKQTPTTQQETSQIIYLNTLAKQREEQEDDSIHISQTTPTKDCDSQYTVRYDVRFLKQKQTNHTEVTRLSPLRFRKKQQVVHHLLRQKIISKQSNSINFT